MSADEKCIRRWYATWTSCGCPTCLPDRRKHRKLMEAGLINRASSDDAWAVIDWMLANRWTPAAIASACGMSQRNAVGLLEEINAGHRRKFGPTHAAGIINHGEPTRGYVGVTVARRKVRALAWMKHSQNVIADAAGFKHWTTVAAIQRGRSARISPRVAGQIDQAWRALNNTEGACDEARERAEAAGWHPPAAFDDINDPTERPKGIVQLRSRAEIVAAANAALDEGRNLAEAARRAQVDVKTVRRARDRRRGEEAA